jgi:hypothetical protein
MQPLLSEKSPLRRTQLVFEPLGALAGRVTPFFLPSFLIGAFPDGGAVTRNMQFFSKKCTTH